MAMDSWTIQWLYFCAELLSCICCLGIVLKLLKHRRESVQTSTVYWILVFFFGHLALWTWFRAMFYLILLADTRLDQRNQETLHLDAYAVKSWKIIVVVLLSDISVVGTSLWFLAMARELYILANKSMTRGAELERIMTRRYVVGVHGIMLLYGSFEIALTLSQGKYMFGGISMVALVANSVQLVGLLYICLKMCALKRRGRDVESVQGKFVPSPLYLRIRNLLVVYSIFSLQFLLCSVVFAETDNVWVIHLSTLFYRMIGVALALLVGCSQQWIVEMFGPCLPKDYVAGFSASTLISYVERLDPPDHDPVFVFTDVEASTALWAIDNGSLMRPANELHDDILRTLLLKYNGYEITTAGDSFQLAFHSIKEAVEYCIEAQVQLLHAKWPKKLRNCGVASAQRERNGGRVVFDGLRVRMGIHDAHEVLEGRLVYGTHPVTGKATYTGLSQVIASKVGDLGQGGQIVMTSRVAKWIEANQTLLEGAASRVQFKSKLCLTSVMQSIDLYELVINGLEARVDSFARRPPRRLQSCIQLPIEGLGGVPRPCAIDPTVELNAYMFLPRRGIY